MGVLSLFGRLGSLDIIVEQQQKHRQCLVRIPTREQRRNYLFVGFFFVKTQCPRLYSGPLGGIAGNFIIYSVGFLFDGRRCSEIVADVFLH